MHLAYIMYVPGLAVERVERPGGGSEESIVLLKSSIDSVLGTTRRTDLEIDQFDKEFQRRNPKYRGLSVNCQCYVRALFAFLLAKGQKTRDLPVPESFGSLLAGPNLPGLGKDRE